MIYQKKKKNEWIFKRFVLGKRVLITFCSSSLRQQIRYLHHPSQILEYDVL